MSETAAKTSSATCPQCGASVSLPDWADTTVCPFCGSSLCAAPAAAPGAEERTLRSLSCPQCAGPLSVRAGRRILLCGHCGVRVLVRTGDGFARWLLPQLPAAPQALAAAKQWLSSYPGISSQARAAGVGHAQLVHVPIWEHRSLVAGWEFGTKIRTMTQLVEDDESRAHLDLNVVEERFQDPHLQERRFFQEACDLTSLGAVRPRFSGRELLLPLLPDEVDPSSTIIEPRSSPADIAARGRNQAVQPASGAADPHTRMLLLRESLALLYYPLWLVDYQSGGDFYRIVIDGRDGGVNSATAPGRKGRFTPVLAAWLAVLAVAFILVLWLGSAWPSLRVPSAFGAVIVCVAAIFLVLRSPSGGKVEYHEPFSS